VTATIPTGHILGTTANATRPKKLWVWLTVAVVVIAATIATALVTRPSPAENLDPRSAAPQGSLALAQILAGLGTRVTTVTSLDAALELASDQTLVVRNDAILTAEAAARLVHQVDQGGQRLVVLGTDGALLVDSWQGLIQNVDPQTPADCKIPAARAAQVAAFTVLAQPGTSDSEACFSRGSAAGLIVEGERFLFVDPSSLANAELEQVGNAALGVNLLSQRSQVVWYLPTAADPGLATAGSMSLAQLLPTWITPVLLQLLFVFVVGALWRGRRLGPLLREDLPVLVQSYETEVGRANLMQRNQDRNGAASALRASARTRLVRMAGLSAASTDAEVIAATATRTGGSPTEVASALTPGHVSSDSDLITLARQLNQLQHGPPHKDTNPYG
jgi:hypothetical protein